MTNIETFKAQIIQCNDIDWASLNTLAVPYEPHESYMKPSKPKLVGIRKRASGNWQVFLNIKVRRKQKFIGTFKEIWDAICARESAENKYNL